MTIATYLHNLRHDFDRWTKGCRAGDTFCVVAETIVADFTPEYAGEQAWRYFQRIEDDHPELDAAQAPSMSIGDVVLVQYQPGEVIALAVRMFGMQLLTETERDAMTVVPRGRRTVAEMVQGR